MTDNDRNILRDLAKQVAEIAARPEQDEKRKLIAAHQQRKPIRPLVFCVPESNGARVELIADHTLACESQEAREIEMDLRMRIYTADHFQDDQICNNTLYVRRALQAPGWDDWGVRPTYINSDFARGAYTWDPPIKSRADIEKITAPTVIHDREGSEQRLECYRDLLGDLMDIRLQGLWVSCGLVDTWTML